MRSKRRIIVGCQIAVVMLFVALPIEAGQRYVDDFAAVHGVWRYANAAAEGGKDGMILNAGRTEVTLPGTVVHPNNVKTFKASLIWNACQIGNPTFSIGWGKPSEWSQFDECQISLSINANGQISVRADQKPIGTWQLPSAENGKYTLAFAQEPDHVTLRAGTSETSIPLPKGHKCRPGYLALRLQKGGDRPDEQFVKVRRIEIDCSDDLPPLTTAERHHDIQLWAKEQLQKNRAMLQRIKSYLQAETEAGRWGFATSMTVSPGLINIGEKSR